MSPRSDDTPRRGTQPRRGTSRDIPSEGDETDQGRSRGFGGIGDARAYTPRGRTVAERDQRTRSPRAGRTSDPFRPALQVLDGGRPQRGRRPTGGIDDAGDTGNAGGIGSAGDTGSAGGTGKTGGRGKTGGAERAGGRGRTGGTAKEGKAAEPGERRTTAAKTRTRDERREPPRSRRPEPDDRDLDELTRRRERAAARGARTREPVGPRAGRDRRTGKPAVKSRAVRTIAPEPPKLANPTRRLRLGTVLALSLFVMIGIRLVVLQVASSPADAKRLIELRATRISDLTLPAPRGSIIDRDGTVLAHSVEARYVGADPTMIRNPSQTAATLAPLIGVPQSKLVPLMTRHKRPGGGESHFEFLAHGVDISVGNRISAMDLPGIVVRQDERRDVPGVDLAANLIGFTGADNSGLEGLEARYDSLLRGTPGEQEYEVGKGDLNSPIPGGYQHYVAPQPGASLELTIDADLQYEVQRILGDQLREWKASIGGAVVLDVKTGEVLAQASFPPYDATKPENYTPENRMDVPSAVVADVGSVHKAIIFGAALQEGIITPQSTLAIGPGLMRGGYPFVDSHPQKKGTLMTMPGLLALSSNVGTIMIADRLGKQRVYEYQQKFGLGKATNEGVAGEQPGKILTPDQWSASASGSVPVGMSMDVTLIQMAAAYAAIANDGLYVQPHLIKAMISGKDGKVTPGPQPETHRVLRPEVASELRTMMEAVVDEEDATGTQARVNGYRVAGKTGTGKRLIDGQYTSSNYGSFIGMAPAENPRFVIAVSAEVPHGAGGDVAAPAFSKMMSFALLQNRVPPSVTKAPTFKIHP